MVTAQALRSLLSTRGHGVDVVVYSNILKNARIPHTSTPAARPAEARRVVVWRPSPGPSRQGERRKERRKVSGTFNLMLAGTKPAICNDWQHCAAHKGS